MKILSIFQTTTNQKINVAYIYYCALNEWVNEKTWNTTSSIICTEKLCETGVTEKGIFLSITYV